MKQWGRLLVGIVVVGLLVAGCGSPGESTEEPPDEQEAETVVASTERLTFAGSTTVQPLAEELAAAYKEEHPGIELVVGAGGSRVGIEAMKNGTADIGMVSRELREDEHMPGVENYQIAIDVLAIIVNPANPIDNLSLEQLRGIYTGEITNWQEVGGGDMPILPLIRDVSSGTRGAFDEIVLEGGDPIETSENSRITAGEIYQSVAETESAIGYVGFGHIGDEIKVTSIDGVEPGPETAMDGSYKLKRPLQLLIGPLSRPEAQSFIDFVLSPAGQTIVAGEDWVPVAPQE